MTPNLANYIFNQETLYKNPVVQEKIVVSEKVAVTAQKPVIRESITQPISTKERVKSPTLLLKHQVLILAESISDSEKAFLSKILTAIGLSLDQVDLVELSKVQNIDYQAFTSQNVTKKFISFGVGLGKLDWNVLLNLYQIRHVAGVDFLLSDELRIVEADLALKKTLWGALKLMFAN